MGVFQSCLTIWGNYWWFSYLRVGTGCIIRDAACTRPLSMSNTDVKILSAVFCHPLNELSKVTVAPIQKCVRGRQMRANVVQAESWGLQQELLAHDPAAILSTGFSVAFPSFLHVWMFAVLNAMNAPFLHH
eukprot:5538595-Pyramimonas_sp.AAC.1